MNYKHHLSAWLLLLSCSAIASATETWEYGRLFVLTIENKTLAEWAAGKEFQFARDIRTDLDEFYRAITGKLWVPPDDARSEPRIFALLLDGIGGAGWELVSSTSERRGEGMYVFKRRVSGK